VHHEVGSLAAGQRRVRALGAPADFAGGVAGGLAHLQLPALALLRIGEAEALGQLHRDRVGALGALAGMADVECGLVVAAGRRAAGWQHHMGASGAHGAEQEDAGKAAKGSGDGHGKSSGHEWVIVG